MLTVITTVLSGVLVFVVGQFILRLIIEPLQEFARIRGEVNYALIYYANFLSNPGLWNPKILDEISDNLRKLSGRFMATANSIRLYDFLFRFRLVPSREDLIKSVRELIFLSNSVHSGDGKSNSNAISNVMKHLNLTSTKPEGWIVDWCQDRESFELSLIFLISFGLVLLPPLPWISTLLPGKSPRKDDMTFRLPIRKHDCIEVMDRFSW